MNYKGDYKIFGTQGIKTHPVKIRKNKVTYDDVLSPDQINTKKLALSNVQKENIRSEDVPLALEKGEFGMAYEFIFQNAAELLRQILIYVPLTPPQCRTSQK